MAGAINSPPVARGGPKDEVLAHAVGPFATVTLLFFFWGFITVMNDVLIPFLKQSFTLTYFQAGLVQFSFFGAFFVISLIYFFVSISSGDPINRMGYQRVIVIALMICAAGCGLFVSAAAAVSYPYFLGALFLLATGVTILQIAANPYAAVLGKPENATARLNLAQGFNSLGTTLAPIAGGLLLYKVFAVEGDVTLDAIKTPYVIFASMFLALAVVMAFSKLPSIASGKNVDEQGSALAFPQLRFGMAAIFLYVGAEVSIGSYLVSFLGDEEVMGLEESLASIYLAYYWGGAMIGRLCGAISMTSMKEPGKKPLYMVLTSALLLTLIYAVTAVRFEEGQLAWKFVPFTSLLPFVGLIGLCLLSFTVVRGKPAPVLSLFSLVLIALLLTGATVTGTVSMWAVLGAGLFNSIMWSNIFTLAIDDLKEHTSQGSSLLVMMIVGGALFPLAMGYAADAFGIRAAFFVPVVSYLYIAWYGWWSQRRLQAKGAAA